MRVLLALLVALAVGACSPDDSGGVSADFTFAVTDSAGVEIAINAGTSCEAPSRVAVSTTPILELPASAEEAEVFAIGFPGARLLRQGGVVVSDATGRRLILYDEHGQRERELLGPGQGPGETSTLFMFRVLGGDTILVWDPRAFRMTRLSRAGDIIAEELVQSVGFPNLAVPQLVSPMGSGAIAFVEPDFRFSERAIQVAYSFRIMTPGGSIVPIESWQGSELPVVGNAEVLNPWEVRPAFASSEGMGGRIHYAPSAGAWELRTYGATGELLRITRADIPRIPVTDSLVEAAARQARRGGGDDVTENLLEAAFRGLPRPDSVPAVRTLRSDERGWVWAGRHAPLEPITRFDVLDASGEWAGCIEVPEDWGELEDVASDRVLVRQTGPLGEQSLRVYPLEWTP